MQNNLQLKHLWIVVFILIIGGAFYFFYSSNPPVVPVQVFSPESYPAGTSVSIYNEIPPLFPKEVVLENQALKYSGTVTTPEGQKKISVSYLSDKSMSDLVALYAKGLPAVGWEIKEKTVYEKVSVIRASKKDQNVLLSIAPLEGKGVVVTFQYEE